MSPTPRTGEAPPKRIRRWLLKHLGGPAGRAAIADLDREYTARRASGRWRWAASWYAVEAVRLRTHFAWYRLRQRSIRAVPGSARDGWSPTEWFAETGRHVVRMFRHAPGFSLAAIVTVALGIAATVSVFSVVNTVLLRPLPFQEPERLVALFEWAVPRDVRENVANPGNARALEERSSRFDRMASVSLQLPLTMTGADEPLEIRGHLTEEDFFQVLGLEAEVGRTFSAGADLSVREVVLSHGLWTRAFGGDPTALGRSLVVNGTSAVIVGVLPPVVVPFGDGSDAWIVSSFEESDQENSGRWIWVVGRLAEGATLEQARAEMTAIGSGLQEEFPGFNAGWVINVKPLTQHLIGDVRQLLWVLLGAVVLLLLIAASNVASLHLVRATERRHEMAIRTSLGASGRRLGGQLLAESLTLAGAGALLGVGLARVGTDIAATHLSSAFAIPRIEELSMDSTVALFAIVITVGTGLLFGLAPALQAARTAPAMALQAESRGPSRRAGRVRGALVVTEVALSLVLLTGAGLVARSFVSLTSVDSGLRPEGVLTGRVNLSAGYDDDSRRQFFPELIQRVAAIPGVTAVGGITFLPMDGLGSATSYWAGDRPAPAEADRTAADVRSVVGDYFGAMGIEVISGSPFDGTERRDEPRKVIINRAAAESFWPGESAVGRPVVYSWGNDIRQEVVGVVADVRTRGLDTEPRGILYMPYEQAPDFNYLSLAIRTPGDPLSLVGPVKNILRDMDPQIPLASPRVMEDLVGASVARPQMTSALMGAFAALAALLSAVGLYGVIAFSVSGRTREIGIRVAVGAGRSDVLGLVVRQGMGLAATGLVLGLIGSLLAGKLLEGLLFSVSPRDPLVLVGSLTLLAAVAFVACLVPAMKAAGIHPREALTAD